MSPVATAAVTARRILVKRPWIYWSLAAIAALGATASMLGRADAVDDARDAWGDTRTVWVATAEHEPGDPLSVTARDVPVAMIAEATAHEIDGLLARQRLTPGEIVHAVDVAAPGGPQAMTPADWLAVPIVESPASGARLGDRVRVVSEGIVIADEALVVGQHSDVTLVAVPSRSAAAIPAAADAGRVTLLLVP